jgi:hypothetical protein
MEETKVIGSRISSEMFLYMPERKEFVAEASDLGRGFNPFSQIWNDSCDAGFVMVGQKTGKELIFTTAHTHRDAEGDITHWSFTAVPSLNKRSGIKFEERIFVTILND